MADSNGVQEHDQDDVNEQDQENEQQDEMSGQDDDQNQDDQSNESDADDEVVITIGGEAPPHEEEEKVAPQWVKDLRKRERELARENRELKAAQAANADPAPTLGAKPTLEACDFDTDRFETELTTWHERKRAVDDLTAKKQKEADDAQKAWQSQLDNYKAQKSALKVPDFEDAEAVVLESLNTTQQGIIVSGADTPANVIYALGKNPAKAKELASIKDPVKFAFAVAKLETQLKVTPRKAPPAPERPVRGSASAVGVNDPKLARLEAAAEKSGDRSELVRYKKQLKEKAAA